MYHSEKPSLKRKSFLNEVTVALGAFMDNMDPQSIENPTKKLKMTIQAEAINDAPNLSITINLESVPKQETNAFTLMKKNSQELDMVQKTLKEQVTNSKIQVKTEENESVLPISPSSSPSKKPKINHRRSFKKSEKEEIIKCHIKYGKAYTMIKHKIKEGTLNTMITKYSKLGEDSFVDKRSYNMRPPLQTFDDQLLNYIEERRKLFLPVSLFGLRAKALELNQDNKEFQASNTWLRNFLKRNGLSLRKRTKKIKKINKEYLNEVKKYFDKLSSLREEEECLFINFDEMSLPFDLMNEHTIDYKGSAQVKLLTHNKEKETCTISTGISSDGKVVLPMIIFKYKYSGKTIPKRTCPKKYEHWTQITHPCISRFTESGFNNNSIMAEWITYLKKKLELDEEKRKVILLLDSAACHKSDDINKAIEGSNIEIVEIPGGCTGFLQPLDTAINRG